MSNSDSNNASYSKEIRKEQEHIKELREKLARTRELRLQIELKEAAEEFQKQKEEEKKQSSGKK